jgi:hypothetical protein
MNGIFMLSHSHKFRPIGELLCGLSRFSQSATPFHERLKVTWLVFQCLIFLQFLQKLSESKIRSCSAWESGPVITVLARVGSNCQSASSFRKRTRLEPSTSQAIISNNSSMFMLALFIDYSSMFLILILQYILIRITYYNCVFVYCILCF